MLAFSLPKFKSLQQFPQFCLCDYLVYFVELISQHMYHSRKTGSFQKYSSFFFVFVSCKYCSSKLFVYLRFISTSWSVPESVCDVSKKSLLVFCSSLTFSDDSFNSLFWCFHYVRDESVLWLLTYVVYWFSVYCILDMKDLFISVFGCASMCSVDFGIFNDTDWVIGNDYYSHYHCSSQSYLQLIKLSSSLLCLYIPTKFTNHHQEVGT